MKQREIKFRAWSKPTSSMSPCADFSEWLRQYQLMLQTNPVKHFEPQNAVLMQFTGLHDKNGKEIYEGDLVTWDAGIAPDHDWEIYKVEFIDGRFQCVPVAPSPNLYEGDVPDAHMEVIGNVYENPELLPKPLEETST